MIELPYPHKSLWPNGRSHWGEKSREVKKHRQWARLAMNTASFCIADNPIALHIIVHPKRRGPTPDLDNIIAASKSYIDGIADYLGIDDKFFAAPTVEISDERTGKFFIKVGE